MNAPRAHAMLSPSKRHRWAKCPASVREEANYPEQRGGKAAADGTHTHTLLDTCLKHRMSPRQYVGQTLRDDDGEFVVDESRAERVEFAIDYIYQRADEIGVLSPLKPVEVIAEDEVNPAPIFGRFDLGGHVDVQIVCDDYLEIIDYKDGVSTVNAEGNLQLEQYAFGALCAHQDHDFNTIRLTIIQPKLRDMGMMGISWTQMTVDQLMARKDIIIAEAAATDDPNAPFNPGEEQCKYCSHKGNCQALNNKVLEAVPFQDLTKMAETKPTELDDRRIVQIMEAIPLIKQFIEGVEEEAQRRLEVGHQIDGLKLVRGRGSNDWALDPESMAERLKKMKVPKDAIWETKIISPAKAKKLRWKTKDGSDAKLTDKQIEMLEKEYIKRSEGALTVALASDKRPAVTMSVASMFGAADFSDLPDFLKPKE